MIILRTDGLRVKPEPLSYLSRYYTHKGYGYKRLGCSRVLTQERQTLAASCYRMALSLAWRFAQLGADYDDAQGAAIDGLMTTAALWDARRGQRFSTYAYRRICFCLMTLSARNRKKRQLCFTDIWRALHAHGERAEPDLEDRRVPSPDREAANRDLLECCRWAVSSEQLWKILAMRFMEKKTLREIGEPFGLSKDRVRQLLAKGIKRIRQRMPKHVEDATASESEKDRSPELPRMNSTAASKTQRLPRARRIGHTNCQLRS